MSEPLVHHVPTQSTVGRNRELLRRARRLPYKETPAGDLDAYVFYPKGHDAGAARPCILFFFGSTWDNGTVSQFAPQCIYLAARGMVAMAVDYRLGARHNAGPLEAMADARSAFRWVRDNAHVLGVDKDRVAGGGASAGAHAVLTAAMAGEGFDEPDEDRALGAGPDAMVLFSPIVDVSRKGVGYDRVGDRRLARRISPLVLVRKGLPPSIIFHGTGDRIIATKPLRKFARRMRWKRNRCVLREFEGQGHGFFNFNVDVRFYEATTTAMDSFLVDLGYLEPLAEEDQGICLD